MQRIMIAGSDRGSVLAGQLHGAKAVMRILLTTDGSMESQNALRAASRLIAPYDREADLLYVAPPAAQLSVRERISRETKRVLQDAKQVLADEKCPASAVCHAGSPARVIRHESTKYDVTVLGAKGRADHSEGGLGPIASRILEHGAGCVLIGRRPPADRQPRILIPVDASDASDQALGMMSSLVDLASADVTLLHVIESMWLPGDEDGEPQEGVDRAEFQLRMEAELLLMESRAKLVPERTGVSTIVRTGIPANEILSEADQGQYDLIVLGASESTNLKHQILGSTSSKVAWNAPCSVLVVRVPE